MQYQKIIGVANAEKLFRANVSTRAGINLELELAYWGENLIHAWNEVRCQEKRYSSDSAVFRLLAAFEGKITLKTNPKSLQEIVPIFPKVGELVILDGKRKCKLVQWMQTPGTGGLVGLEDAQTGEYITDYIHEERIVALGN